MTVRCNWRRRGVAACLIMLCLHPRAAPAQQPRKLNVGTLAAHDFDPAYVALDGGLFAKYGLDVTLTRIAAVANVPPALFSNSIDIAPASPVALLQGAEAGLDLVGIAGAARGRADAADSSLITLASSAIRKPEDFVGKKIGVNSINSFWHLMLQRWLSLHHVDPDRVTWVEVALSYQRDALRRGSVDAVAAVEPFRSNMLHDADFRDAADYPLEVNATGIESLWMAARPWAVRHAEEVNAFRAAMRDATTYIAEHPTEADALIAKHWNVATVASPSYFNKLEPVDFAFFIALTQQFGVITGKPDPASLILPD